MAVTITKKFWEGSEYKSLAKIVFTSPNFTSPAVAGTRSHMPPGGIYMGTWFEAVDWMYRQKQNQNYTELPTEMESFFGKLTLSGTFDLDNDTSALFTHEYGEDYDVVGTGIYPNILYKDKDNYAVIATCISGTISGTSPIYTSAVTFSNVEGTGVLNGWIGCTTSGVLNTLISGNANPVGTTTVVDVSEIITTQANNENNTILTGTIGGGITGILSSIGTETVSGTLTSNISGRAFKNVPGKIDEIYSNISDSVSVIMTGHDYGTASGVMLTTFSGFVGEAGETLDVFVSDEVTAQTDDSRNVTVTGTVDGVVSCTINSSGGNFVNGTLTGVVSGELIGDDDGDLVRSTVSGTPSIYFFGTKNTIIVDTDDTCQVSGPATGVIRGTLDSSFSGNYVEPSVVMNHQYSNTVVDASTSSPRPRRHHGSNSIIFTVTFGEAYNCRLTAWDDDTHSTTTNKVIDEEHYRVDAVAYRSNIIDTAHTPIFRTTNNLIYPQVYDIALKGNERYYGDFDLVFAIETDNYGEYLAFIPRLINMDSSFVAGSYDFVTTLHYQYT